MADPDDYEPDYEPTVVPKTDGCTDCENNGEEGACEDCEQEYYADMMSACPRYAGCSGCDTCNGTAGLFQDVR
jgi:hypothetical protein